MNLKSKKISITIPAFNEEKTIYQVVKNAVSAVSKITPKYEILLVNDGSTDNTLSEMNKLKKRYKNKIRIVNHLKNKGFSGALKSCYINANGDYIFLGPADGQFNYAELTKFVRKIEKYDIVVAFRVSNEESLYRKVNSYLFHLLSKVLFNIKLREFSTCMLYSKEVRDSIKIQASPDSALFLPEFFYKSIQKKYRISQAPIHFYKRKGGVQKGSNPKVIINTLVEMLKFWFHIHFKIQKK